MNRIYQINIRQYLYENNIKKLIEIDNEFLKELKSLGFGVIWLMGIWKITKYSREKSIELYKNTEKSNIVGSCFAIEDYIFDEEFCNEDEVLLLKKRLNGIGIKLILDFVPNHFGRLTNLLQSNPQIFLEGNNQSDYCFESNGKWFANAKDPNFEPWTDTVQLDYSKGKTIEFMYNKLLYICKFCDGIRCDMAMLILPEVFSKTWNLEINQECFWKTSLLSIKQLFPDFTFIGEVYWGYNAKMYDYGFDFCYQKGFLDSLKNSDIISAIEKIKDPRDIMFLENHDEERAINVFGQSDLRTYFGICCKLSNMFLVQHGQLYSQSNRIPIQILDKPILAKEINTNFKQILQDSTF
jgi:glycosidase